MTKALFKFDNISGMNNVDKSNRLPYKRDPATYAVLNDVADIINLDIDNQNVLQTRPGYSLEVTGTFMHSLWSNGSLCFFIDGASLYQLHEDYSITELLTGLTYGARMSYDDFNGKIYMTNNNYIGYYLNQQMNALANPNKTYKQPLPAGRFIVSFMAKLYVASGRVLYISDALCDHYDVRTGFRVFENDITMLRPVPNGGIYIAAGKTWFMHSGEQLSLHPVFGSDAIPGTDLTVDGEDIGDSGVQGMVALWVSSEGICIGDSKGNVKNITQGKYKLGDHGIGAAVLRTVDNLKHYITVLE